MIAGVPWPLWVGIAGTGYLLFATFALFVMRKIVTGDLLTAREGNALREQLGVLRAANAEQGAQITTLVQHQSTALSVMNALHEAVDDTRGRTT